MKVRTSGFTLVEVVIIATILSIFASIVGFSSLRAYQTSRDTDRQADLRALQAAVELYKQKNGRYPEGCNTAGNWSGQLGSSFQCADGSTQYIKDIAPAFIPTLPLDKRVPDGNAGYRYAVNLDRSVYKIEAHRTVESEIVTYEHPFKICDANNDAYNTNDYYDTAPVCNALLSTGNKPNHCQESDSRFQTSYAVWGGFAPGSGTEIGSSIDNSEEIICK